ncbi:MAG: RES family NAD+ phosphorylase [Woeseiaceae bacterium]|nr:RES family NAD+ phosphorylase [Woeseiaceae bacterium]
MAKPDAPAWRRLLGRATPRTLLGTLSRLVEHQQRKVTLALVDTLAEHEVLEDLLEDSKPVPDVHPRLRRLDYLLRTPWRYPPLPWGSRFGRRFEPGIFYGSLSAAALFAEAAYYRLLFLEGMETPFADRVISQFTVFDANFRTGQGLDLSQPPFDRHESTLRHPVDYGPCQLLGTELRERGIEAITYLSARSRERAMNVALFSPTRCARAGTATRATACARRAPTK